MPVQRLPADAELGAEVADLGVGLSHGGDGEVSRPTIYRHLAERVGATAGSAT